MYVANCMSISSGNRKFSKTYSLPHCYRAVVFIYALPCACCNLKLYFLTSLPSYDTSAQFVTSGRLWSVTSGREKRNGMVGDTFRGSNNPATSRLWCNKDRIVSWYYVTSLANQSLLTVIKFYVEKKKRSGVQATLYFTEVGGR